MMKFIKPLSITLALLILFMGAGLFIGTMHLKAAGEAKAQPAQTEQVGSQDDSKKETAEEAGGFSTAGKALGAAIAIGLAAMGGALGMGNAISKAADGVARQPEAQSQIQTMLMLGLVFIETVVIYALIVAILIVFVM